MTNPLFQRNQSFLAVIDVQQFFLDKLALADRAPLAARIAWLIRVATSLDIPVLAMAEDIGPNGPPAPQIAAALPQGAHVHDKRVFGLAHQPDILAAAKAFNRSQAVLVGLETDVCVAHSALGLLEHGFRVAAIGDATGSPGNHHAAGLARMKEAGVTITTTKGIFYEWVRDLDTLATLRALRKDLPPGLTL